MAVPERNAVKHRLDRPGLGLGLGLRNCHFEHIVSNWPEIDWFEAISENFMDSGGRPRWIINQVAERYPVVLHGVSMSIGSTDPLNFSYLSKLKALAKEVNAAWVSDHLCWTGVMGINSHDLLPVPLTEEALQHISARVLQVQDYLEQPLVLENPSTYISFSDSQMSEPEFLTELVNLTGCRLLLDVNNVFVSCFNSDTDPQAYLDAFPYDSVVQLHLAGHQDCGTHIIDTHDGPVRQEVWELFRQVWARCNGVATLLEWDGNIPAFDACHAELLKARNYMEAGHIQTADPRPQPESTGSISNPVDFLVPQVMDSSVMEHR